MCRLYGALTGVSRTHLPDLVESPKSLFAQSRADPKRPQKDGWGIGWYPSYPTMPELVRSARPVFQEPGRFREAAGQARAALIVAHIRYASNPLVLPRPQLIGEANSQPFTFGRYVFAHNGTLNIPREVARSLGEWEVRIKGHNDSEVLFWLVMKGVQDARGDLAEGLRQAVRHIGIVWDVLMPKPGPAPYTALNLILADGERLAALCLYQEKHADESQALCSPDRPYYEMCYRESPEGLRVASEPTDGSRNWRSLPNGRLLLAEPGCPAIVKPFTP